MSAVLTEPPVAIEPAAGVRLDAHSNGIEMTPAEFDAITDWDPGYRYELIHGVVVVSPIPGEGESDPNGQLEYLLRRYQQEHPQGGCLDKTLPERYVYLPDGSRRRPDRVIWAGLGRLPKPKLDVPTIVVEFVSASRRDWMRDYVTKRGEYLALGVREYWLIDRFRGRMHVFRAESETVLTRGQTHATDLLPGFTLSLDALLNLADEWRDA